MAAKRTKRAKPTRKTAKAKKTVKTKKTAKAKTSTMKLKKLKTGKSRTKSEIFTAIAETTALTRKDVIAVFDAFGVVMQQDLGKKGSGVFMMPGLMKIRVVKKPATKARKGVNPFTGESMMFKAKPARNMVRIRPLSGLKAMV